MTSHTAFVVSKRKAKEGDTTHRIRKAARSAQRRIEEFLSSTQPFEEAYPRSVSIGFVNPGLIQGDHSQDREETGQSMEIWNREQGFVGQAGDAPGEILRRAWNTGDQLTRLAFLTQKDAYPVFPNMLINTDGSVRHHLSRPGYDVYEDREPGGTASICLPDRDPAAAWEPALEPCRDLERVKFRVNYLHDLDLCRNNIVIQFGWIL